MTDGTLTTTTPDGVSTTRPVAPSWASVAPLLARWQMALVPHRDGQWDVLAGFVESWRPHHDARCIPFAALPQAIADVAAQCEREKRRKEEGGRRKGRPAHGNDSAAEEDTR